MRLFDGPFALVAGFIGVAGFGFAIYNRTLDPGAVILFGLLTGVGLLATWRRLRGDQTTSTRSRRPLSSRSKKKSS